MMMMRMSDLGFHGSVVQEAEEDVTTMTNDPHPPGSVVALEAVEAVMKMRTAQAGSAVVDVAEILVDSPGVD